MRLCALTVVLALTSGYVSAGELPTVSVGPRGLELERLPPVLGEPAVAKHLNTGLTTIFQLAVVGRAGLDLEGAAQVSVRYDLWDEVYRVERLDAAGAGEQVTLPSPEKLREWWRSLVLLLGPSPPSPLPPVSQARVTLQVLPFSQAEQRDAQEWLLRSFRRSDPAPIPEGRPDAEAAPRAPVRAFYGAMLASSIGRRSLITYSWTVLVGAAP